MKTKIKQAAIELFHKKGYFATSMSAIANATGIRKASIYHHYAGKEDILVDIFTTTMRDLIDQFHIQVDAAPNVRAKMKAAVEFHVLFHIDQQKETIIADSELRGLTAINYQTIIDMRDQYETAFQTVIQEGIDQGLFQEADSKVIAYAIITMCTAVCAWFKRSGRLSKTEVASIYSDFVLNGLTG